MQPFYSYSRFMFTCVESQIDDRACVHLLKVWIYNFERKIFSNWYLIFYNIRIIISNHVYNFFKNILCVCHQNSMNKKFCRLYMVCFTSYNYIYVLHMYSYFIQWSSQRFVKNDEKNISLKFLCLFLIKDFFVDMVNRFKIFFWIKFSCMCDHFFLEIWLR